MANSTRLDPITSGKPAGAPASNQYGTFKVHYCSPAQARFIQRLLDERDHQFDIADATKVNKKHASRIIEGLLACPKKAGVFTPPTEKQLSFLDLLSKTRESAETIIKFDLYQNGVQSIHELQRDQITLLINALVAQPKLPYVDPELEVGAYLHDGVIYSVRKGRESGRLQAYIYNADDKHWDFVREAVAKIKPAERLTLSQAVQHSAQTGSCVHCGRTLTLQKSVMAGMGKICASKYF